MVDSRRHFFFEIAIGPRGIDGVTARQCTITSPVLSQHLQQSPALLL